MKLYKKKIRAVVFDIVIDNHFCPLPPIYYDWYDEEDFPKNMEEIVERDNPFGGLYKYCEEVCYEEVKKEDLTNNYSSHAWDFHWDCRGDYEQSRAGFYGEFS